jgi:hypothetical protein
MSKSVISHSVYEHFRHHVYVSTARYRDLWGTNESCFSKAPICRSGKSNMPMKTSEGRRCDDTSPSHYTWPSGSQSCGQGPPGVHDQILANIRNTGVCQSSGVLSVEGAGLSVSVGHHVGLLSELAYTHSSILNDKKYEVVTLYTRLQYNRGLPRTSM